MSKIRVRIAPSPTGHLHLGTARAALFNFLFARQNKGKFILRVEDTDLQRSDEIFTKEILQGLEWLGLSWDEGPKRGGEYAPYRQSERQETYGQYIKKLLRAGLAYYCFCSEEKLDKERRVSLAAGQPPKYSGKCRALNPSQIKKFQEQGRCSIIRFKIPAGKIKFKDLIRGQLEFDSALIGDISIAKDELTPLYNFAVVVDDATMKISHVIRGEDHISNTPKQILIAKALGFQPPYYAHLPLILGSDKSKLSKRHGAVPLLEYRERGYLSEAMVNFMALLGWNPGSEKEIFSLEELIKEFSLERVHKGGAIFNLEKLDWLNGYYIKQKSPKELTSLCLPFLVEANFISPKGEKYLIKHTGEMVEKKYLQKIIVLEQERMKKLKEVAELSDFFFFKKLKYAWEFLIWKKSNEKETLKNLKQLRRALSSLKAENFTAKNLEKTALKLCAKDRGAVLWPLRAALTGKKASPGPFEVGEILGQKKSLERLDAAIRLLEK